MKCQILGVLCLAFLLETDGSSIYRYKTARAGQKCTDLKSNRLPQKSCRAIQTLGDCRAAGRDLNWVKNTPKVEYDTSCHRNWAGCSNYQKTIPAMYGDTGVFRTPFRSTSSNPSVTRECHAVNVGRSSWQGDTRLYWSSELCRTIGVSDRDSCFKWYGREKLETCDFYCACDCGWEKCSPGYVSNPTDIFAPCIRCGVGTYSDGTTACLTQPALTCNINFGIINKGSITKRNVCEKCAEGYYSVGGTDAKCLKRPDCAANNMYWKDSKCHTLTDCKPAEYEKQKPTATSDRVCELSFSPTSSPTETPTASPTQSPTASPTQSPTARPTQSPTARPTQSPTAKPTQSPSARPTQSPTTSPTQSPTARPTRSPTTNPTQSPTASPTSFPTANPTEAPTEAPGMSDVALVSLGGGGAALLAFAALCFIKLRGSGAIGKARIPNINTELTDVQVWTKSPMQPRANIHREEP